MEDQMAIQNPSIRLKLDHYAIVAGSVAVTATLSHSVEALEKEGIQLSFTASDGSVTRPDETGKVVTVTWTPGASSAQVKKETITATLRKSGPGGGEVATASEQLSIVRNPNMTRAIASPDEMTEGGLIRLAATMSGSQNSDWLGDRDLSIKWIVANDSAVTQDGADRLKATWDTTGSVPGIYPITARLVDRKGIPVNNDDSELIERETEATVLLRPLSRGDTLPVTLKRTTAARTRDQVLWSLVRDRTAALSFTGGGYKQFIDRVLCDPAAGNDLRGLSGRVTELGTHAYGMAAYELLKTATEVYLLIECGVAIDKSFDAARFDPDAEAARLGERLSVTDLRTRLNGYFHSGRLPYLNRVIDAVFPAGREDVDSIFCPGALSSRVAAPCLLELIWSYWHEEGMLVQTMNAISRRFQNVRGPGDRDPLAHFEIDPLRPLNNLLWGYVQDEQNLLTVKRRAYEYDHHYGLTIHGKAVPPLRPADSRSKFLEAFHNLLHLTSVFYKEDNDTTVIADGFPLLNALREVHLILAQGAHNQFGDLPWTARAEMLMQQWLLARPEMREFLQSRPMVPYKEPWMGQVDTMKTLQGWSDITVTHFRDLGAYGEQILLTIRYGDWIDINDEDSAKNWARYWRPEVQSYIHSYRIVTGIDLSNPERVDYTMPAVHLQRRLAMQRAR
jgi:hypothetical protein